MMHQLCANMWRVLIVCLGLKIQPSTATSLIIKGFERLCVGCGGLLRARMQKITFKLNGNNISRTDKKPSTLSTPSTLINNYNKNHIVILFRVVLITINIPSTVN